jgi:hypothetical protein
MMNSRADAVRPPPPPGDMTPLQPRRLLDDSQGANQESMAVVSPANVVNAHSENNDEGVRGGGNPNAPPVELHLDIEGPAWPTTGNWGNDAVARLFHVFAETKVRDFVIRKDTRASRAELQAGQTPKDKFWSVVHWLFNYGYVSDWFHPQNEFGEVISRVAGINPDEIGQKRDVKYLKDKYIATRKTVAHMMECYRKSGQNVDATAPWADPAIEDFFDLSGGGSKRGNAGVFYAFLLSLRYPILQDLVEVCMGESLRESGSVVLEGEVLGGAAASAASKEGSAGKDDSSGSFLDDTTSTSSSSSGKRRRGVNQQVDDVCREMKRHLRMERESPQVCMQELVATMSKLQKQGMDGASFILRHEAAILAAGGDPREDGILQMMKD